MDVSLRGAVSIARRLQDPLAELVKIDPKSIGVGQYQHDLSEVKLSRSLDAVVEDCVNGVGVDVNTASAPLLSRVSGISSGLAENIVAHRDANGPFTLPHGAEERGAARPEGVRAVRGLPADPRRRRPAGRVQRAPGGVSGGAADGEDGGRARSPSLIGNTAVLRVAAARRLRGRDVRSADGDGHPEASWRSRGATRGPPSRRPPSRRASRRSATWRPGWCWRASSRTWRRSARSSTSASTRTVWCMCRRCRRRSSRTRATW